MFKVNGKVQAKHDRRQYHFPVIIVDTFNDLMLLNPLLFYRIKNLKR
jgi:hypothetical protein